VHRGAVTGANKVWIESEHSRDLPPCVMYASVTKARELFNAGVALMDSQKLRRVIDIPTDLDTFDGAERRVVESFLKWAKSVGADQGYVAKHRRPWWSVGLRPPPPIMATYMARRPPAFVENRAGARYINIAHGIYPREPLTDIQLRTLAGYLGEAGRTAQGRVYAGGLMKFEPREMERILVPRPELLAAAE
jgi:adenine-specific DNA-methyltransferase